MLSPIPKFRAWDGKKFHYSPDFNIYFSRRGIVVGLMNGGMIFVEGDELQQFTGYTDMNDVEIYGGDKLIHKSRHGDYIGQVEFSMGYHLSEFCVKWEGDSCTVRMNKCKVVGHVFDGGK